MVKESPTKVFFCEVCGKKYELKRDAELCEKSCRRNEVIRNIERAKEFTITPNHLKLLKSMYVDWDDCEYGAPAIDPKRPYGNSDVQNDIAEIIGLPKSGKNWDSEDEAWSDAVNEELYLLHRQMQLVLQIVLVTGKFEEGEYIKKEDYDSLSWCVKTNESVGEKHG